MIREEGGFETGGTRSQRAAVSLFKSLKLTLMLGGWALWTFFCSF